MFLELKADHQITDVGHELHSRGHGYLALDRRKQFLFVGTSLRNLQLGIDLYAKEEVGRTSMYDSAACARRGYVGSFRFERCEGSALPTLVQQQRARYERVIICASSRGAWGLTRVKEQTKVEEDTCDESLVVE
jgi:hypothetical protein